MGSKGNNKNQPNTPGREVPETNPGHEQPEVMPSRPGRIHEQNEPEAGGRGPDRGGADEKTGQGKTPEIGRRDAGRGEQGGPPHHDEPGRGSSIQGKHQDARGGPMGANQGGAPRGGSRVEPSHVHEQMKKDKGDSRAPKGAK